MSGVAQRVGRDIALLFHDRGTRRVLVVSSTPRPHFTPGKYPVPILQEVGWAAGPVWTRGKSRPHRETRNYQYIIYYSFEVRWNIYVYTTYKVNLGVSYDPQETDHSPQNQPKGSAL